MVRARFCDIDVSARFQFTGPVTRGNYAYVEARGELGRPGTVVRHRSPSAQRGVSAGTGDDAGHLIGDRFGPPGDARNLTQQHRYMNQNGTFRRLEDQWERLLHAGTRVEVVTRGQGMPAVVTARPLYREGTVRSPKPRRTE